MLYSVKKKQCRRLLPSLQHCSGGKGDVSSLAFVTNCHVIGVEMGVPRNYDCDCSLAVTFSLVRLTETNNVTTYFACINTFSFSLLSDLVFLFPAS